MSDDELNFLFNQSYRTLSVFVQLPVAETSSDNDEDKQESDQINGERAKSVSASVDTEKSLPTDIGNRRQSKPPAALIYLDSQCDRYRVQCLLHALNDASDQTAIANLSKVAERHGLRRLLRIMGETIALSSQDDDSEQTTTHRRVAWTLANLRLNLPAFKRRLFE